jgi:hypothetical protein
VRRALGLLTLAALACSSDPLRSRTWGRLPQREQDRYWRCSYAVKANQCGAEDVNSAACAQGVARRFLQEPTELTRARWLRTNGCPDETVRYEEPTDRRALAVRRAGPTWDARDFARQQGVPPDGAVESREDRARGESTLLARMPVGPFFVTLRAIRTADTLSPVFASFLLSSPEMRYEECHALELAVDDQPIAPESPEHSSRRREDGGIVETVSAVLRMADNARVAGAASLRARVCRDDVEFSAAQVARVAEFYQRYSEWRGDLRPAGVWYSADAGR